ncbi:hypothetical protein [Streptomyces sp. H27-D2]|uniref:hypothetical protein n=1 Tax=Streptomyces sp. H27-D2 TaxID=3046304 RepID=UPI002DBF5D33|nr:hypothetical protein [Streptomyces sp. H27-D2]MEC4018590.1 hypothetical protein [Streptomyces sp. H27-D2]
MSDSPSPTSQSLQAEYEAKLAADLERNAAERERLTEQMAVFEKELKVLERNRAMLLEMQQAVGSAGTATDADTAENKSAPRTSGESKVPKARQAKGAKAAKGRTAASAAKTRTEDAGAQKPPSLVQLVRDYLAGQSEPKSAAEVAADVTERHPERTVTVNAIRTALEALVAKSAVRRAPQGKSVYYDHVPAADTDAKPADADQAAPTPA